MKNIIKNMIGNERRVLHYLMQTATQVSIVVLIVLSISSNLVAQNDLACINHINFSLDPTTCRGSITAGMAMVGDQTCADGFEITVRNEHDQVVPNEFTIDDVGNTFTYMLCCGSNCCWGTVTVEYKSNFAIACPPNDTIPCGTLDFYNFFPPTNGGCSNIEIILLHQEKTHVNCDPALTATVERTYKILDDFGNFKKCDQTLSLSRVDPGDILWPGNTSVSCSSNSLVFNEDGAPFPWYYQPMTGSGTGLGVGIPLICGVGAPFEHFFPEMKPDEEPNPYGVTINYQQHGGGTGSGTGSGTAFFCPGTGSGTGAFPLIPTGGAVLIGETGDPDDPDIHEVFFTDNSTALYCNTQLSYTDLILPPINGGCHRKIARTWELREWWCTDELLTTSLQVIEIIDDKAPDFVCPGEYTISTNADCSANIHLPLLNPVDQCGVTSTVTVNYNGGLIEGDGALVHMELGKNHVTYVVSDACHNSATCHSIVTIVDGTEPIAICDPHKVVSLSSLNENKISATVFDNNSFDDCGIDKMEARRMDVKCDSLATEWGEYVEFCCEDVLQGEVMVAFRVVDKSGNQSVCMVGVEVQDKLTPELTCPPDATIDCAQGFDLNNLGLTFGIPQYSGTCTNAQIPEETLHSEANQCGVGKLYRTFKLRDGQGSVAESCTQIITIENANPFTSSNITWPLDFEHNSGCGIEILEPQHLPDGFGYPSIFGENACSLIGYDYEDKVYDGDPGSFACVVIERTWTVVNWCAQAGSEYEVYVIPEPQIIKLRNTSAPVLDDNMSITYDAHNSNCDDNQVLVVRTAVDDCVTELDWSYTVFDRDGVKVAEGASNTLQNTFPLGAYTVEWTVSDGCGNSDTDIQDLNVFDGTPPTPVCHNGLSASLVGDDTDGDGTIDTETVELWASDFDAGSYPNCNNPITFSFSSDTTDNVMYFDCSHIGIQEIDLWVTDVYSGAQDFCTGFIDIQDEGLCPDQHIVVTVEGQVHTETLQMIQGVSVMLEANAGMSSTDLSGTYAFENMPMGGDYQVIPQHDINYSNGVSTIDIIMIQRHILGIESLDSPYKLIAADIDGNERINGVDLVELRKLILGIYQDLPQNTSWRFVSSDHVFVDPTNPWTGPIPERYDINNLSGDMNLDFIGVKIGDVNDDVVLNATGEPDNHSAGLSFDARISMVNQGDVESIPVYATDYKDIIGWQTTFTYDADRIEILAVIPGALNFQENEHSYMGKQGLMSISYDGEAQSVEEDVVLFELQVRALKDISAGEEVVQVTSDLTRSEAYDKNFVKYGINSHKLKVEEAEILSLYPNPFVKEAELSFFHPEGGAARFEFYDVNGKVLKVIDGDFKPGSNRLSLNRSDFETTGMVYIRMLTESNSITEYRMIVL